MDQLLELINDLVIEVLYLDYQDEGKGQLGDWRDGVTEGNEDFQGLEGVVPAPGEVHVYVDIVGFESEWETWNASVPGHLHDFGLKLIILRPRILILLQFQHLKPFQLFMQRE